MQSSAALNNTQEVISGSLIDIAGEGNSVDPNSTGSRVQPYNAGEFANGAQRQNPKNGQFKYSEEDGFLRGARIAEKI